MNFSSKEAFAALWLAGIVAVVLFVSLAIALTATK